jgi:hypothetical protein
MPKYVLSFRGQNGRNANPAEEAAWGKWFQEIAPSIADFGNRVGEATPLGNCGPNTGLSGYVLINADDLNGAVALAKGCPGLKSDGGVEVGTTVDMS